MLAQSCADVGDQETAAEYMEIARAIRALLKERDTLIESVSEMVKAMELYEMEVEESPPYKHRQMMARARALLSPNTPAQPPKVG
ncbi:hypothetical protein OpiT1DRAFT_05679 [Opitutaceae bacterium TAV1]|nr:hypothetical protein OpiT1DRAFT_05679 [Opitutaceae bacterium TAV1]